MGYANRQGYYKKCYIPTADIIIANDTQRDTMDTSYVKLKQITLGAAVVQGSVFRFLFDLNTSSGGNTVYGRIFKNGVALGTEQSVTAAGYITKSEDITMTNFLVGDTIELWGKTAAGLSFMLCRNFRICGVGSEFINTLGA